MTYSREEMIDGGGSHGLSKKVGERGLTSTDEMRLGVNRKIHAKSGNWLLLLLNWCLPLRKEEQVYPCKLYRGLLTNDPLSKKYHQMVLKDQMNALCWRGEGVLNAKLIT